MTSAKSGPIVEGHALLAFSCPVSSLELMVEDLIPRRDANVVVMDGGNSNAIALGRTAVERLDNLGFTRVGLLAGGVGGWEAAGYRLFSGIHVFSKLFGEHIERIHATPEVEASKLAHTLAKGGPCIVVDTRPRHEFAQSTIPGSINVPAGELLRTLPSLVADRATDVVVHCGGRTRGIIAAQSLIAAGLPQRVAVLKNGTIGWRLAALRPCAASAADRSKALPASTWFECTPIDCWNAARSSASTTRG